MLILDAFIFALGAPLYYIWSLWPALRHLHILWAGKAEKGEVTLLRVTLTIFFSLAYTHLSKLDRFKYQHDKILTQ